LLLSKERNMINNKSYQLSALNGGNSTAVATAVAKERIEDWLPKSSSVFSTFPLLEMSDTAAWEV
jgi:hypothetical protein